MPQGKCKKTTNNNHSYNNVQKKLLNYEKKQLKQYSKKSGNLSTYLKHSKQLLKTLSANIESTHERCLIFKFLSLVPHNPPNNWCLIPDHTNKKLFAPYSKHYCAYLGEVEEICLIMSRSLSLALELSTKMNF